MDLTHNSSSQIHKKKKYIMNALKIDAKKQCVNIFCVREKFTRRSRERRDYLILFVGGPEFYVELFSIVVRQYFFENSDGYRGRPAICRLF
jgi:hypothetical protein